MFSRWGSVLSSSLDDHGPRARRDDDECECKVESHLLHRARNCRWHHGHEVHDEVKDRAGTDLPAIKRRRSPMKSNDVPVAAIEKLIDYLWEFDCYERGPFSRSVKDVALWLSTQPGVRRDWRAIIKKDAAEKAA
jgi:hypothetical protein